MALSNSDRFYRQVGDELAGQLGANWKFFKSRLELRRKTAWGHQSICLTGGTQYSPHISLEFYFGANFREARAVEKRLQIEPAYYHIHYYSLNHSRMQGLDWRGAGSWEVDLDAPRPQELLEEVLAAVKGIAFPFFDRYTDLETARLGLLGRDWCFGSGEAMWHGLLAIEEALGERDRFLAWAETHLSDFAQQQVRLAVARLD